MTTTQKLPVTVMIVDDSPEFLAAACAWVATYPGMRLIGTARNGEDAVAAVEQSSPDLVLMDAFMPRMDGFEATRATKSRPRAPIVVILSLSEGAAIEREAWAAGADGFLAKREFAAKLPGLLRDFFGCVAEPLGGGAAPRARAPRPTEQP